MSLLLNSSKKDLNAATGRRRFLQNKTKTVRHQNTFVSNTQNISGKYKHPIFYYLYIFNKM